MSGESLRERVERIAGTAKGAAAAMSEDNRGIMAEVRMIGGGLVMMLIITLVLTEVFNSVDFATDNGTYTGPFGDVIAALETTGVSALVLMVVGFLVVAASAIMRYFGTGFGGGGR